MKSNIATVFTLLALAGCGSEYGPDDIEVSSNGAFVERGSDSPLDGTFIVEKVTGESLEVEFDDGLPSGDVEMRNEEGKVILSSSFVKKTKQQSLGRGASFLNELFKSSSGELSTQDYLGMFKDLSEFDGDYLRIDNRNRKTEGVYKNGEEIGRWKVYCENQQLESDRTYKEFSTKDKGSNIGKIGDEKMFTCNGDVLLSATRDNEGRLQGEYIENHAPSRYSQSKEEANSKPLAKYVRNYKDGEFDGKQVEYNRKGVISKENNYAKGVLNGLQKEYDRDGNLRLENNYKNSVKHGEEKVYASRLNYTTNETSHWLSETKNYIDGKLDGQYQKFDSLNRSLQLGNYQNDKPVNLWTVNDYSRNTRRLVDYDANNFTIEKEKPFKEACFLPSYYGYRSDWSKTRKSDLSNCEYYVEKGLVDINKKISLERVNPFESSSNWTYPAIVAGPRIYEYMKTHGLETRVADAFGKTRVHLCLTQYRSQTSRHPKCSIDQLTSYADDVDLNSVSNVGTAFHYLAKPYQYLRASQYKALLADEKKIAEILIAKGANINLTNHQNISPLMAAVESGNYGIAEFLIDAGASVNGESAQGKNVLGHFFISSREKLKRKKISSDATRVLAKLIALGVDANAPAYDGKTIQTLSEEQNKLFHIQSLKDAKAMSTEFAEELKSRPEVTPFETVEATSNEPETQAEVQASTERSPAVAVVTEPSPEQEPSASASENSSLSTTTNSNVQEPASELTQELAQAPLNQSEAEQVTPTALVPQSGENDIEPTAAANDTAQLLKKQAAFLVAQANEHVDNFRLQTPKSNSALGSLEQLKAIDPNNENIALIEKRIGEKYLGLASKKVDQGQKSAAQKHLNSAKKFISDESLLASHQAKVDATQAPQSAVAKTKPANTANSAAPSSTPLNCDPTVKLSGIPLIGGQLFTAQQLLPLSPQDTLSRSLKAVNLSYENVQSSGNKITYEQSTSGKPITATLSVTPSGDFAKIVIKAKTPAGVVIKKSGFKQSFCDLLADF